MVTWFRMATIWSLWSLSKLLVGARGDGARKSLGKAEVAEVEARRSRSMVLMAIPGGLVKGAGLLLLLYSINSSIIL